MDQDRITQLPLDSDMLYQTGWVRTSAMNLSGRGEQLAIAFALQITKRTNLGLSPKCAFGHQPRVRGLLATQRPQTFTR